MKKYHPLFLLSAGILTIFIMRAVLAQIINMPHTFEIFDVITIVGAAIFVWQNHHHLHRSDWGLALTFSILIGIGMQFATLYTPYPFFGIVKTNTGHAVIRSAFTFIAMLGGLAIMRQEGPVSFPLANGRWHQVLRNTLLGLGIGLPLAVVNVFALQFIQGQSIQLQNPLAALADAIQPGIVEEVIYRFVLWGLLWLVVRTSLPEQAAWIAGLLAMLVHNYSHFDDLFLQSPLVALGMGAGLALVWGLPPMILARRKGLEAAITFHWIQDAARFVAGF